MGRVSGGERKEERGGMKMAEGADAELGGMAGWRDGGDAGLRIAKSAGYPTTHTPYEFPAHIIQ